MKYIRKSKETSKDGREGRQKEKSSYVGISVDREIERERDGEMLMR